jgi:hypothetical protein
MRGWASLPCKSRSRIHTLVFPSFSLTQNILIYNKIAGLWLWELANRFVYCAHCHGELTKASQAILLAVHACHKELLWASRVDELLRVLFAWRPDGRFIFSWEWDSHQAGSFKCRWTVNEPCWNETWTWLTPGQKWSPRSSMEQQRFINAKHAYSNTHRSKASNTTQVCILLSWSGTIFKKGWLTVVITYEPHCLVDCYQYSSK